MAEHYCIEASPGEVELKVEAAEPEFEAVAVELEKGPHLPEVLEPRESPTGLKAEEVGRVFEHFE